MDDVQEVIVSACSIVSYTNDLQTQVEKFRDVYFSWAPRRRETVSLLRNIGKEIDKHHKNSNIAIVVGGSAAAVGGAMVAAGLGAAPFTGGASLPVTGLGVVIGALGGVTHGGSYITDLVLQQKYKKKAIGIVESDRELTETLAGIVSRIQQLTDNIETAAEFIVQYHRAQQEAYASLCRSNGDRNNAVIVRSSCTRSPLQDIFEELLTILPEYLLNPQLLNQALSKFNLNPQNVIKAVKWLMKLFGKTFKTVSHNIAKHGMKLVIGVIVVMTGIVVALETIHTVMTVIDIRRGSKTKTAQDLYSIADTLEKEATTANEFFEALIDLESLSQ